MKKHIRTTAGLLALMLVFTGGVATAGENVSFTAPITASAETYSGLRYAIKDGEVVIMGFDESVTEVVIPSEIDGLPVTAIGDFAFSDCSSLTSVTIPDSVTRIGEYAFYGCSGLTSVTIPESVINISSNAFYTTPWLESKQAENPLVIVNGILIDGRTCKGDVIIPDGVTSIGGGAFGCSSLTSVTIPDSVTSIGDSAFGYCINLTSVNIPDSVTSIGERAFNDCISLTSVTIPDGVTNIDKYAFDNCSSLESVTIPESVTSIGRDAFYGTAWLANKRAENPFVTVNGILIDAGTCQTEEIVIPDYVTSIADEAFHGNAFTKSITVPKSVKSIGYNAFKCRNLTSITIMNPDCEIYDYYDTFDNGDGHYYGTICGYEGSTAQAYAKKYACDFSVISPVEYKYEITEENTVVITGCDTDITEAVIPSEIDGRPVTIIGDLAFSDCSNLTSVIIPDSITRIGEYAFGGCSGLTSVTIPDSVTFIGEDAFDQTPWLESKRAENPLVIVNGILIDGRTCTGDVIIPDGVTSIGNYAFQNCNSITSVKIPDGVTSIGDHAFHGCNALTSITIPDSVTSIGYEGLYGNPWFKAKQAENPLVTVNGILIDGRTCTGDVIIPDGVTSIGDFAFSSCSGLTSVKIPDSVTSIGSGAFWGCNILTSVTIPDSVTSIGNSAFAYCFHLKSITIMNPDCEIYDYKYTFETDDSCVIYSYEGSTAQAHAEKYGYKFESLGKAPAYDTADGDINGDGEFNIADAVAFQKYILGVSDAEISDPKKADLFPDGRLDVFDLCLMKKKIAEKK